MTSLSRHLKELSNQIVLGKIEKTLIFVFIFAILFPFPKGGDHFFWKYFFDAGHPILFFICTIFIYRIYRPLKNHNTNNHKLALVVIASLLIATALEGIQPIFGRAAGLKDLVLGYLGVITASLVLTKNPLLKILGLLSFILVQSVAFKPASIAIEAIDWRKNNFPLLANFEKKEQMPLWKGGIKRVYGDKTYFLKIFPNEYDDYWAKYFAGDKDWSKFNYLNLAIYSPIKSKINLRIDDDGDCTNYDDRFNKEFKLDYGWNNIELSIEEIRNTTKDFNLKKIRFIYFFDIDYNGDTVDDYTWVALDNIELRN